MQCLTTVGLLCVALACLAYADNEKPSPPAHYDFTYAVNEPSTGDQKDQHETREGDNVNGYYRTLDADGYLRTVKYKSDAVNGFTAEVVREPVSGASVPVPAAKAAVKTVVQQYAPPAVQPVQYAPPAVQPVQYAPPVVQRVAEPAVVPIATPAPYAAPAPSYYPYQYQPSYSYGYQPYPYAYSPYPYGVPYPYSGPYPYPYPAAEPTSPPTVRK